MDDTVINKIKPFLEGKEACLVGGYLREKLAGKTSFDRDITIKAKDFRLKFLCQKIADDTGGSFVELDSDFEIYRVIWGKDYADFARMANDDIDFDIERRDFTINSILYDINNDKIIDKANGRKDFENKIIKTVKLSNLSDDPLRTLRAFRFQAELGFEIDPPIKEFIKKCGNEILKCAPERLNQEIIKMFSGAYIVKALLEADETGMLEILFPVFFEIKKIPPNSHHHLDLFHHLIETVSYVRIDKPELKLAAFLHDIAKPDCWTIDKTENPPRHRFIGHDELGGEKVIPILKKLKFSNKQIEYISKMIKYHIYPSALMSQPERTERGIIRFIKKIGEDVPDLIELARADRLSARGEAVSDEIVEKNLKNLETLLIEYENIYPKLKKLPKLIDGHKIMEILNIPPSPLLKDIINEIKDLQLEGKISSEIEAVEFIEKKYLKQTGFDK